MWGRIANMATQMDDSFGHDDDGAGSAALPSDADDSKDNNNGWGDDDFDDDLDLDFDDEPSENGLKDDEANGLPSGEQHTVEEEANFVNYETADDGGTGYLVTKTEVNLLIADSEEYQTLDEAAAVEGISSGVGEITKDDADNEDSQEIEEAHSPPLPQSLPQSAPQNYDHPDMVTVSAPGKALIAGGYLVLESPNPGVVLAAEGCRFHATVAFRPPYPVGSRAIGNSADASEESISLDVYSPQFDRVYSYYLSYSSSSSEQDDNTALRLYPRKRPHEPNKFVERSLLLALGYLRQSLGAGAFHARLRQHSGRDGDERAALAIKLRADNDFYSQIARLNENGWDLTPQNLERLEPFLPCPKDESTGELVVNKTGMGSSAALVTSIVGALLRFFGVIHLPNTADGVGDDSEVANETNGGRREEKEGLRIAHNLSQICHCHAQGKVGSGFDVSSAVYGSHVYTRFSKGVISDFLENVESTAKMAEDGLELSDTLLEQLVVLVNDIEWDCTVRPVSLPPGVELLMADVCGGSESPSMARNVLDWKKNKRKLGFMDDYYWKDLKRCNNKIVSMLSDKLKDQTFLDGLRRDGAMIISTRTAEQWKKPMPSSWYKFEGSSWDVALKLLDLRMTLLECRQNLKGMGKSAGVPIEPDEQTAVADATMKLPGVIAAGVPGAGGYDALFVIYVKGPETNGGNSDQVRDEIGNLWRETSRKNEETVICPLSVRAAGFGDGLRATKLDW